jgi:hypothetical protein
VLKWSGGAGGRRGVKELPEVDIAIDSVNCEKF